MERPQAIEPAERQRLTYREPEIQDLGSMVELTQATPNTGGAVDNSYGPGRAS